MLVVLGVAHLAATLWLTPHGHLNVDECTYHLMLRAADEGTLAFWNGYEALASRELVWPTTVPHEGALYPVTPPFYAAMAWPFYALAGFPGLFVMNAVLFVGLLALTAATARRLFDDERLAWTAVGVLALATYAWEYSQAAWPHISSTVFVMGALLCALIALDTRDRARGVAAALFAGALLGAGLGIRLDVAMAAPAVILPFLFAPAERRWRVLAIAIGALPPLLLLAFVNHAKFGIASPLSYGPKVSPAGEWTRYLPVALLGLVLVGAAGALQRPGVRASLHARRGPVALAILVGAAIALFVPELRAFLLRLARGVWILLVDLRGLPEGMVRPALSRSAGDGLVYFGHLKKSWLQSLPYLGVLAVPAIAALRGHPERGRLALLALLPASHLAAYGLFRWDGGMSLNLRYLTPALPCVAIGVAWALRALGASEHRVTMRIAGAASVVLFFLLSALRGDTPDRMELFVLDTPLLLAAGVLAASVTAALVAAPRLRAAALATTAAALVWAGLVAFTYDYPAVRWLRGYNLDLSQRTAAVVPRDALLFVTHPDPFCGLLESERVRIALPARDRYRDFRRVADFHLEADRPVFAAMPVNGWRMLERGPKLEGLRTEEVLAHPIFSVRRIRDGHAP